MVGVALQFYGCFVLKACDIASVAFHASWTRSMSKLVHYPHDSSASQVLNSQPTNPCAHLSICARKVRLVATVALVVILVLTPSHGSCIGKAARHARLLHDIIFIDIVLWYTFGLPLARLMVGVASQLVVSSF